MAAFFVAPASLPAFLNLFQDLKKFKSLDIFRHTSTKCYRLPLSTAFIFGPGLES
jgi:hypothetical protein